MVAMWSRISVALLLLVLLALVALIAMQARDAKGGPLDPPGSPGSTESIRLPGSPISQPTSFPIVLNQPGRYYLTENISVPGNQIGIYITSSGVSLDLGGFTVDGDDTTGSYGILIFSSDPPLRHLRISNGDVTDFHLGVAAAAGLGVRLADLSAMSNIRGFEVGLLAVVSNCFAFDNEETGIFVPGSAAVIGECVSARNGEGITLQGDSNVVEQSQFHANVPGGDVRITGDKNVFRGNVVDLGFRVDGTENVIIDNACSDPLAFIWEPAPGLDNVTTAPDHLNANCELN